MHVRVLAQVVRVDGDVLVMTSYPARVQTVDVSLRGFASAVPIAGSLVEIEGTYDGAELHPVDVWLVALPPSHADLAALAAAEKLDSL